MDPRPADPKTVTVTDHDFMLEGGVPLSLTLREGEFFERNGTALTIAFDDTGETYDIAENKILYHRYHQRTMTAADPAPTASVPAATSPRSYESIDSLQSLPVTRTGRS